MKRCFLEFVSLFTVPFTALLMVLFSGILFSETLFFETRAMAQERQILLTVSRNADPAIKKAALSLKDCSVFVTLELSGAASDAQFIPMASERLLPDSEFKLAAYNNLVIVGLPEQDVLLKKCLGHQIALRSGEVESLGYGKWKGDFGTVECDRNPFLYSHKVKDNPYSTLIIKISGTSVAGVVKAVDAFRAGMLNGIVPAGQGELVETTILDRQPEFIVPPLLPDRLDEFYRVGWTQPNEMEYRAYLDLAGFEPKQLWRIKYLSKNVFDDVSGEGWNNGLHRLAYGNAVTIAEFNSEQEAKETWNSFNKSNGAVLETIENFQCYRFAQPTDEAFDKSYGDVRYFVSGKKLIAVSLPKTQTLLLIKEL
jgi:hypothetical protein